MTGHFYIKSNGSLMNATRRERLLFGAVIDKNTGCWVWQRSLTAEGYSNYGGSDGATQNTAHRQSYEEFVGPIPPDMTVDHICFNPPCINPFHLQLLTHVENCGRKQTLGRPACNRGHAYTPQNAGIESDTGRRRCLACRRIAHAAYRERKRAERQAAAAEQQQDVA